MSGNTFKVYDFEHPSAAFIFEDMLKWFIGGPLFYNPHYKTFGLKGVERVLDFGCGGGAGSRCLVNLLGEDGHLTCVDISNYWLRKAEKRLRKYPNVKCMAGDIRKLDIPDSSFDVISVIHVIHDIAPPDRQDTVSVLSRTLKTGGRFFIWEPTKESHGIPAEEIRALLSGAGLNESEYAANESKYIGTYLKTG
jgi:ubiquinone/menaquinone biosynthesis C-methylase UbiE